MQIQGAFMTRQFGQFSIVNGAFIRRKGAFNNRGLCAKGGFANVNGVIRFGKEKFYQFF
jgi:hypothetical protein